MIGSMPGIGAAREAPQLKTQIFPKNGYLIFYQVHGDGVEILRVLHTARDWPKLVR
jgi:toxin ParE1/3/4